MSWRDCAAARSMDVAVRRDGCFRSPAILRGFVATLVALLALVAIQPAAAQRDNAPFAVAYTGTLKKINDSGVVHIGYRENSPPFAFLGPDNKPIGYSLDLCEIVVEEIAAELGKDIRTEYRPVTPENRFDLVNAGEIDLECGSTTNNVERRKVAAFSPTTRKSAPDRVCASIP